MINHFELNRRDFFRAGALTSAYTGAWAAAPSLLADDTVAAGLIDAHSHIWTRDVAKFPLADGQTVDDLYPPSFTAEELIGTTESVGVRREIFA